MMLRAGSRRLSVFNLITFNQADLQNRRLGGVFNFGDTVDGIYPPVGSLE